MARIDGKRRLRVTELNFTSDHSQRNSGGRALRASRHKLFVMMPSSMTDAVKQSNIDQNKESSSVLKPHPENASAAASQGPGSQPPERLDDDRGGGGGGTSSSGGDGGDKTGSGDEPCGNAHETKKPLSHRNQPLEKQEMEHEGEKQQMNRDAQSAESLGSQDKEPQHGDTAAIGGVTSMVGMAKENESSHMGTASLVGFEDPDQIDSSSISDSMGLAILAPGPFFCSCGGGGDGTTDGGTYVPQVGDQVVYFQQAQEEINRQSKMATPLRKDGDVSSAATKPLSLSFAEKKLMQPSWFGKPGLLMPLTALWWLCTIGSRKTTDNDSMTVWTSFCPE